MKHEQVKSWFLSTLEHLKITKKDKDLISVNELMEILCWDWNNNSLHIQLFGIYEGGALWKGAKLFYKELEKEITKLLGEF